MHNGELLFIPARTTERVRSDAASRYPDFAVADDIWHAREKLWAHFWAHPVVLSTALLTWVPFQVRSKLEKSGPASFNAELTQQGGEVVSVDPLYAFNLNQIRNRIDETFDTVMQETRANAGEFVWRHIPSIDDLGAVRMKAMQTFLSDYPQGRMNGRYLAEALPSLSLPDGVFDLAVCSHFLFLYSNHLDLGFHIEAITELCRISGETRIFPLLQLGATPSPHVRPVSEHFGAKGYEVVQIPVPYEFQRGGNQMLRIRKVA